MRSEDCQAFLSIVQAFVKELPEAMRPRLSSRDVQRLQSGSVGCVGNLSAWFDRALVRGVQSGSKALEWSHFEATVLPDRKLIQMREDCEKGERCFRDLSAQTEEVLMRSVVPEDESSEDVAATPAASGKGSGRRPGTPNCSGLRTSAVVLENIAVFGSDYLRMKQPPGSHYLRMSADYLRRAHLVENETKAAPAAGSCYKASPTARIRSANSRVPPASS